MRLKEVSEMIDPKKIRQDFPMYRNNVTMQKKPLIWLDNASTTFKPDCVIEAITDYYTKETSNSHRGDYDLCYNMDMKVLESRKAVARFINSDSREVVFTSGTTNSINLVAFGYGVKYLKAVPLLVLLYLFCHVCLFSFRTSQSAVCLRFSCLPCCEGGGWPATIGTYTYDSGRSR